jgi:predicted N-formylglutamate amidohydrolase
MATTEYRLLGNADPPPVEILRPDGLSPLFLTCDHAGRRFPVALGTLGVGPADLERHIACDIGAAGVTRALSERLDATAILQRYSRLVVDCNRSPAAHDYIAVKSEDTEIPGNRHVAAADVEARTREIFTPYHEAIRAALDARAAARRWTVLVAVHSCTPVYHGVWRPWHVGVLYDRDDRFARIMLDLLSEDGALTVGENQPYELTHDRDYSVPLHGEDRGLLHVELEIRQDLIGDADGQEAWAARLATILGRGLERLQLSGLT